jgi:DNA topoisomerase-1
MFTVTLDEAVAIFAQPKQRGRTAAKPPLRELGADPTSGRELVIKEGRFGLYVTDGETNASLRVADDPATISVERASDLLSERRAKEALDGGASKSTKRVVKAKPRKPAARGAAKKPAGAKAGSR